MMCKGQLQMPFETVSCRRRSCVEVVDSRPKQVTNAMVTCEIKLLFQNYFSLRRHTSEIILPEIILETYCSS